MKVVLSVIFLVLSLVYGVQGVGQCVRDVGSDASFCGCQLQDANSKTLINITLDFVGIMYDYIDVSMTVTSVFF